jgi:hypothetical protein
LYKHASPINEGRIKWKGMEYKILPDDDELYTISVVKKINANIAQNHQEINFEYKDFPTTPSDCTQLKSAP